MKSNLETVTPLREGQKAKLKSSFAKTIRGASAKVRAQENVNFKLEAIACSNEELIGNIETTNKNVIAQDDELGSDASNGCARLAPKVSVLVPVFNTGEYLHKCLDSLINQSLRDIEIICVDDGSEDDSLAILHNFSKIDSRIKVFEQRYSGVSVARNVALDNASSPYIMFCDSDDWFDPMMCEKMYQTITEQNVDVAICGWNIIFEISTELRQGVEEYLRLKYNGYQFISWKKIIKTDVSLCNKIYKKQIINSRKIRFPDGLLFEDAYFNDAYMVSARTAYYLNMPLYNYLRHERSIMSSSYKKIGTAADYLEIAFRTFEFLKRYEILDQFRSYFWNRFIQYYSFSKDHLIGEERAAMVAKARKFIQEQHHELEGVRKDIKIRVESFAKNHGKVAGFFVRLFAYIYRNSSSFRKTISETDDLVCTLQEQQKVISKLTQGTNKISNSSATKI